MSFTSKNIVVVAKSCLAWQDTESGAGEMDSGLLSGGRLWNRKNGVLDCSTMSTDGRDVVTITAAAGLNQALLS